MEKAMDKAREFYINTISHDNGDATHDIQQVFSDDDHTIGKLTDYTHVIEYSAYEPLQARVPELEASHKEYHGYLRDYVQKLASDNPKYLGLHLADVIVQDHKALTEKIQSLEARLATIKAVVDEQAEDEGLWCVNLPGDEENWITCGEAYIQQALRHLHNVIEDKLQEPAP